MTVWIYQLTSSDRLNTVVNPDSPRYGEPGVDTAPVIVNQSGEAFSLKAVVSDSDKQLAKDKAQLIVSGNSATRGGGIGANGGIIIGEEDGFNPDPNPDPNPNPNPDPDPNPNPDLNPNPDSNPNPNPDPDPNPNPDLNPNPDSNPNPNPDFDQKPDSENQTKPNSDNVKEESQKYPNKNTENNIPENDSSENIKQPVSDKVIPNTGDSVPVAALVLAGLSLTSVLLLTKKH